MKFFDRKICLRALSKNAKGEIKVKKQKRLKCKESKCATLKALYALRMKVVSHKPCDKLPGLDGRFEARLRVATKDDGHGRGFHMAKYRWETRSGEVIVGRMRGITNASSQRDCQKCDVRGHMEGVLGGKIVEGKRKGCRVRASYVIKYDPGQAAQNTAIRVAIEGVMVCRCK